MQLLTAFRENLISTSEKEIPVTGERKILCDRIVELNLQSGLLGSRYIQRRKVLERYNFWAAACGYSIALSSLYPFHFLMAEEYKVWRHRNPLAVRRYNCYAGFSVLVSAFITFWLQSRWGFSAESVRCMERIKQLDDIAWECCVKEFLLRRSRIDLEDAAVALEEQTQLFQTVPPIAVD